MRVPVARKLRAALEHVLGDGRADDVLGVVDVHERLRDRVLPLQDVPVLHDQAIVADIHDGADLLVVARHDVVAVHRTSLFARK